MEDDLPRTRVVHGPRGHHLAPSLDIIHGAPHVRLDHGWVVRSGAGIANTAPGAVARRGRRVGVAGVHLIVKGFRRHVDGVRREDRALGRLGGAGVHSLLPAALDPLVAVLVRRGEMLPDLAVARGQAPRVPDVCKLQTKLDEGLLVELVMVSLETDVS